VYQILVIYLFIYLFYYRLGIHAFLQILNKKQNYHQGVLTYLKKIQEDFHLKDKKLLNTIVDWNFSSIFDKMNF
jgi:hypothetical protein